MAATAAYKRAIADAIAARGAVLSLHSADPGTTGANELAGGGYARKTTVWGAAVDGAGADAGKAVATGTDQTFDVEAGDSALWMGVWHATGPTFQYGKQLSPGITITAGGANGQVKVTPTIVYGDPT